jgi:hypothetical protein
MASSTPKARNYVVLRQMSTNQFSIVGSVEAESTEKAIGSLVSEEGQYVAIPSRSFTVVPVRVEQVAPKLVIGEKKEKKPVLAADRVLGAIRQAAVAAGRSDDDAA